MNRPILYILLFIGIISCTKSPVVIIDEQIQSENELKKMDSADIFSYNLWPVGFKPSKYAKYKNDNLILVITNKFEEKAQLERYRTIQETLDLSEKGSDILIMYNGIEVPNEKLSRFRSIRAKDLKSVHKYEKEAIQMVLEEKTKEINLIINTYDLKGDLIEKE